MTSEKPANQRPIAVRCGHHTNTLAVVAQHLGAEGFNEYVASAVDRYVRKRMMNERQVAKMERLKKDFGEIMRGLTEAQRLTVGTFIHRKQHSCFDAGLRIGLLRHVESTMSGDQAVHEDAE